jgi:hypothetical protein
MHGDAADGEHGPVLGHEEERPAQTAIFGMEAGHQLALGLGEVERSAFALGGGAGEVGPEGEERERIVKQIPVPDAAPCWLLM